MRINLNKLIHEYNQERGKAKGLDPISECLTKADIAREATERGIYKNPASARVSLQIYEKGPVVNMNTRLMDYLKEKFGKSTDEILTD